MEFSMKEALGIIIALAVCSLVVLGLFHFGPLGRIIKDCINSCL